VRSPRITQAPRRLAHAARWFHNPRTVIVHAIQVDGGHVLHVEEHGNPAGIPALLLHGGPGSGSAPMLGSFFDPAQYRLICPDQRGAGLSRPAGRIEGNTTAHLVADLRLLGERLRVPRWLVVGGSWGATLALVHALDAPDAIAGLLLRNVFLARRQDIDGFFDGAVLQGGPVWRELQRRAAAAGAPLVAILADLFAHGTGDEQRRAAAAWLEWEQRLAGEPVVPVAAPAIDRLVHRYRIQAHYLRHRCWLDHPGLVERCRRLPAVPTLLLHGTEDRICPPEGAMELAAVLGPRATLHLVHGAGHQPFHPGMRTAMEEALHRFAVSGSFHPPLANPDGCQSRPGQ
jgi:proline iminopeptidase